jgi:hypothetical protein
LKGHKRPMVIGGVMGRVGGDKAVREQKRRASTAPTCERKGETEVTHSATPTHIEWVKQPFAKRTWATQPRSPKL